MNGDENRAGAEYDQPRVPTVLRERAQELFVAERGYEPASFQEALSVVLDLAETASETNGSEQTGAAGTDGPTHQQPTDPSASDTSSTGSSSTGISSTDTSASSTDASTGSTDDSADTADVSLSDPSVDPEEDSVSFDEYVEGLEETRQDPSPAVESILDTEHADDAVREIAAEVLDEMTQDAFQELEHGVDQGVGTGVTDGMGGTRAVSGDGTAPSGSKGDGVPDSLTADPESDCAVCGREHPVSVLQTTILEEDGSIALVCPSCAE